MTLVPSPALLIIMDGWGLGNGSHSDAIAHAHTPYFNQLKLNYPMSKLTTCGEDVGLPEGQMGNSEVGHLNIGAGRVVYQELARINKAIRTGELMQHPVLVNALKQAAKNDQTVHFLGLVSDGGVHAHINHLKALVDMIESFNITQSYVHAFTDGRDCDPKSGKGFIEDLQQHLAEKKTKLASIIGRYYAMDRDKRWERVKQAYDLLVHGHGVSVDDFPAAIEAKYQEGITDEFLPPLVSQLHSTTIKEGDLVIFFNFRTDRGRELTQVLSQNDFPEYEMHALQLDYITLTRYDANFKRVGVVFENEDLSETLGEVLEKAGKKQIRIAETEKYPHVTFFFSGGREMPFEGEKRILVPSPKVATYDLQPEMSALQLTEQLLPEIENQSADFICLNFANPDMVGHTGVYNAIVKAVETVDHCVETLCKAALAAGYRVLVTADHGNADYAENPDGSPNTAHSLNPVPLIVCGLSEGYQLKDGRLADIAPTVLEIMGIEAPKAMSGQSLLQS